MTTDASREVDDDVDQDDGADAGRPSLADWLVVSVRPSQMPPAAAPAAAEDAPPPLPEAEAEALPAAAAGDADADATPSTDVTEPVAHAAVAAMTAEAVSEFTEGADADASAEVDDAVDAPDEGLAAVDPDDPEFGSSKTLPPQIFSDGEEDEELAVVLLGPAARARRAAAVRAALFLLGALLVVFFLGRRFLRDRQGPPPAQTVAAPVVPAPVAPAVTAELPDETLAEEDGLDDEPSSSGALESTGRGSHSPPPESTSAAPLMAPAWSVARFPDLPRDVLIACEQAALQAHSAAPPASEPPPSGPQ